MGVRLRRYRSKEAAGGQPAADTALPRGTAAQGLAWKGFTVDLVSLYAPTAQPLGLLWLTEQLQGSQGHRTEPDKASRGGAE